MQVQRRVNLNFELSFLRTDRKFNVQFVHFLKSKILSVPVEVMGPIFLVECSFTFLQSNFTTNLIMQFLSRRKLL
jgi:hypothetical protein